MLIVSTISIFAQQANGSQNLFAQQPITSKNPFAKLSFLNGATDTITLVTSYSNVNRKLSGANAAIINTITQNTGKKVKGLNYSVDIKLDNYAVISIPCADNNMLETLLSNADKNNQVVVKCVVYRFYYFDGICNFLYINKISLLNKSNLITKTI